MLSVAVVAMIAVLPDIVVSIRLILTPELTALNPGDTAIAFLPNKVSSISSHTVALLSAVPDGE